MSQQQPNQIEPLWQVYKDHPNKKPYETIYFWLSLFTYLISFGMLIGGIILLVDSDYYFDIGLTLTIIGAVLFFVVAPILAWEAQHIEQAIWHFTRDEIQKALNEGRSISLETIRVRHPTYSMKHLRQAMEWIQLNDLMKFRLDNDVIYPYEEGAVSKSELEKIADKFINMN